MNQEQKEAIQQKGNNLLIIAGPGTGKTYTLTHRIARMVVDLEKDQNALAITFTNKAAEEMFHRLEGMSKDLTKKVFVGTFHSFCLHILKQHVDKTFLPRDFKVSLPEDIQDLVKQLWPELSKRERKRILEEISQWKSAPEKYFKRKEVDSYNDFLRQNNFVDYDDLLLETVDLLRKEKAVLLSVQKKYSYIFVDEYQDINPVQHSLLTLLISEKNMITAIGDPNQSIYGFRGSDVHYFESFISDFSRAKTLSLVKNYRATPNLLEASEGIISKSEFVVPAITAEIFVKGKLIVYEASTEKAEAEYVVHQTERMLGGTSLFSLDSKRVESEKAYFFGIFC